MQTILCYLLVEINVLMLQVLFEKYSCVLIGEAVSDRDLISCQSSIAFQLLWLEVEKTAENNIAQLWQWQGLSKLGQTKTKKRNPPCFKSLIWIDYPTFGQINKRVGVPRT